MKARHIVQGEWRQQAMIATPARPPRLPPVSRILGWRSCQVPDFLSRRDNDEAHPEGRTCSCKGTSPMPWLPDGRQTGVKVPQGDFLLRTHV